MSAGDQNGDGRADILISAPLNDTRGLDAGAVYGVFGKTTNAAVDLGALGTGGYRILGGGAGDNADQSIGTLTDVNDDGRQELLIGATGFKIGGGGCGGGNHNGAVYVVFGRSATTDVNLGNLGSNGYRIIGQTQDRIG
jgi:hypothetical protein